ncbi:MAG: HD domain-containing protein [Deltaproteobacteria bacterium]|nr:HD domain-containing protein [Deltaproteobacteria bacterium]
MNDQNAGADHIKVKDLRAGDTVEQYFQLRAKSLRKTRSGAEYLDLVLGDASGAISGKVWAEAMRKWGQDFEPGDFVKVVARVETFRDVSQLVVEKIRRAQESEATDLSRLVRTSSRDPGELFMELKLLASQLNSPDLADLVQEILDSNEDAFRTSPAARMIHHAYKGGLVEHTLSLTRKVEAVLPLVEKVNRDLAIAGAILHDIGKIRELDPSGRGRTPEGKLIGHLILGVALVREAAMKKGLESRPWLKELEHILVSHHGESVFGSPVRPLTREALVVHFMDNLDSKLKIMEEALESVDPDGFSAYNKWLEGRAYAGSQSFQEEEDDART